MGESTTLDERYADSSRIEDFSLPESRALIDLAFIMIMVDREISEAEMETLRGQLEKLPFATKGQADRALADHIDRSQQTVGQLVQDREGRRGFIEGATQRIQGRADREFVLEFLSLLSAADDYHGAETQVWVEVADAFGVDEDELPAYWAGDHVEL